MNVSKVINTGSRVIKTEVERNGVWVPLNQSATYTVLVNQWTLSGGDGHYIFLRDDLSKENTTMVTTDILAGYVQQQKVVSPQLEERIHIVPKKP